MNELTLITTRPYNFKRIWQKICMVIAKQPLTLPKFRYTFLKWGGKFEGFLFYR